MTVPILVQRFQRLTATPQRRVAVMAVVATVVGLVLMSVLWTGPVWTAYELTGTGLVVELPAPPQATSSGGADTKVPLFQMRCPEMAVLASGGAVPAGGTADAGFLARQAMAQIGVTPGISDLDYRLGKQQLNGQACLMVGGTFHRDGVPGRLSGAFFVGPATHGHIICLWSDPKGARLASRVLRSVRQAP